MTPGVFKCPVVWTQKTAAAFEAFLKNEQSDELKIFWNWEPYHRVGFNILSWAHKNHIGLDRLEEIVSDLSCLSAPNFLIPELQRLNLLDEDGRIKPLDLEPQIKATFETIWETNRFSEIENGFLPTVSELERFVKKHAPCLSPHVESGTKFHEMSNWFTKDPSLMKRFQHLSDWQTLSLAEILLGTVESASIIGFSRL
jgi:hypothetical protein